MTSTKGVTLISAFCSMPDSPPEPESLAAIRLRPPLSSWREMALVSSATKTFSTRPIVGDAGLEVVIEENRRDGREEAETGGQQRLGNPGGDGGQLVVPVLAMLMNDTMIRRPCRTGRRRGCFAPTEARNCMPPARRRDSEA